MLLKYISIDSTVVRDEKTQYAVLKYSVKKNLLVIGTTLKNMRYALDITRHFSIIESDEESEPEPSFKYRGYVRYEVGINCMNFMKKLEELEQHGTHEIEKLKNIERLM